MADLNVSNKENIAIAMATFNGEKYLAAQIESILSQSYSDWVLFIHDDGSSDNTIAIIEQYAVKYPKKIISIEDNTLFSSHGGAMSNFFGILEWIRKNDPAFSYFMLCDQDDWWLPNKIAEEVKAIKRIEESGAIPAVVHSDVMITDESLTILSDSFYTYAGLEPTKSNLSSLVMDNVFIGCTMLWNKKLNDILDFFPEHALMHDWWIGLSSAVVGKVGYICCPLMYYRQHGNNTVGAKEKAYSAAYFSSKLRTIQQLRANYLACFQQAGCVLKAYEGQMDEDKSQVLGAIVQIPSMPKVKRVQTIHKYHIFRQKRISRFAEILLI